MKHIEALTDHIAKMDNAIEQCGVAAGCSRGQGLIDRISELVTENASLQAAAHPPLTRAEQAAAYLAWNQYVLEHGGETPPGQPVCPPL